MKTITKTILMSALLTIFSVTSHAQEKTSVTALTWMSGCWELNVAPQKMTITEQWMKPGGGLMIGMSRTVKAEKTLMFEFLRIAEKEDGVYYVAKPSSAKDETNFKLVKWSKGEAVFENLAHDFPQRIIYKHEKADSLAARIESADGKKGMDIPMTRAKCE